MCRPGPFCQQEKPEGQHGKNLQPPAIGSPIGEQVCRMDRLSQLLHQHFLIPLRPENQLPIVGDRLLRFGRRQPPAHCSAEFFQILFSGQRLYLLYPAHLDILHYGKIFSTVKNTLLSLMCFVKRNLGGQDHLRRSILLLLQDFPTLSQRITMSAVMTFALSLRPKQLL